MDVPRPARHRQKTKEKVGNIVSLEIQNFWRFIVEFTGSLWRVKQRSYSLVILPMPMSFSDWINTSRTDMPCISCLEEGTILIVGADELFPTKIEWRHRDTFCRYQTFRQVVSPAFGYLSSTYFNKDSFWLERIT